VSLNSVRIPGLIQPHQHCDNGLYPDATFYGRATLAVNHCLSYRRKLVYQRTWKLGASGGASGVVGWWHCHTGHGARRFSVMAVLGLDDRLLATEPYIKVTLTKSAGSPASVEFHGGASDIASVDAPDQMIVQRATIPAVADSTYTGEVEFFDNVRVISLLVFEDYEVTVDDSAVLVKYTYVGDANLDGQVDALDYERIDLAIGNTGVFGVAQGDLNYDGAVDALDYEQVDLNIGNGVGSPLAGVFIPEPASLSLLAVAGGLLARRRRA
jgi:hypothetical protein